MPTKTTGRSKASLALVTVLALIAAMFTMASPASAGQGTDKVTICHRTASEQNPYRKITVNVDGSNGKLRGDHLSHEGPVFPATAGDPPKWGDIIPPYETPYGTLGGQNWPEGWNPNDFECPTSEDITLTEVYPEEPTVTPPTCDAPGTLTVPDDTEEITYSTTYEPGDTGSFTVTATVTDPKKYVFPNDTGTQTFGPYEVLPQLSPTDPKCVKAVTPEAPSFTEPTCTTTAAVILPKDTDAVKYAVVSGTPGPGATVTVKATLAEGYTLADGAKGEWTHTYVTAASLNCTVPPAKATVTAPTFTDVTCEAPNGSSMTIPADTAQIDYTTKGTATPNSTVVVTATAIGNVVLVDYPANGWSHTFVTVASLNCNDEAVGGDEDATAPDDEDSVAASEDELAATGGSAGPAGLGFLLILSGAAFVTARRLALR